MNARDALEETTDPSKKRGAPKQRTILHRIARVARWSLIAVVGAGLLVTTVAFTAAVRSSPPGDEVRPPNDLEQSVGQLFGSRCVSQSEATEKIRRILDSLGYNEWAIQPGSGLTTDGCVAAGLLTSKKAVLLVPIARPEVASAIQSVADELLHRCLGKDAAIELLSSVLRANNVNEFSISTDGPIAYPMGQEAAVATHLVAGCYIYSGSSRDGDGRPVYYISGQRP